MKKIILSLIGLLLILLSVFAVFLIQNNNKSTPVVSHSESHQKTNKVESQLKTSKKETISEKTTQRTTVTFVYTCKNCNNEVSSDEEYCSLHACAYGGCPNEKFAASDYCFMHKCRSAGCGNESHMGQYCNEHKCERCNSEVSYGSRYCYAHKCRSCGNMADASGFCFMHDPMR